MAVGRRRSASSSRVSSSGALAAVRAAPDVARRQRDAGLAQRAAHALQAPLAGGEGERVVLDVADEGDVAVAGLEQMARGHRAAGDVVDGHVGQQRVRDVDQDRRHPVAVQRADLGRPERQRDDDHPVDAVAAGEAPQRGAALVERLDVEERQVVGAAPDDVVDAAQALDHGRAGEERGDHAERLGAPERQVARGRAGAVAELVHDGAHAHAGGLGHPGESLSTRETVPMPTPARSATSRIRGARGPGRSGALATTRSRYPRTRGVTQRGPGGDGGRALALRDGPPPTAPAVRPRGDQGARARPHAPVGAGGAGRLARAAAAARHRAGRRPGRGLVGGRGRADARAPGRPRRLPGVGRRLGRGRRGAPARVPRRPSCWACSSASSSRWATPAWATRSARADRGERRLGAGAPGEGQRLVENRALRKRQMSATGSARDQICTPSTSPTKNRSQVPAVVADDAAAVGRVVDDRACSRACPSRPRRRR